MRRQFGLILAVILFITCFLAVLGTAGTVTMSAERMVITTAGSKKRSNNLPKKKTRMS